MRPCLVLEVVSPQYQEVRDNDYVSKVEIYERAGIPEYLIVEPSLTRGGRILLTGYRLGLDEDRRGIEPDGEGRLLRRRPASSSAWPKTDPSAWDRLPYRRTADEAQPTRGARRAGIRSAKAAEERAAREASENARLRAELERLRKTSS